MMARCGAKHALYNAFQALLDEGDEVIMPAPYWVSYPDMVLARRRRRRCIVATGAEAAASASSAAQLAAAITPRTRAIVLNSPSNPTGAVYTRDDARALADVVAAQPRRLS